jgi:hypothetical protein
MRQTKKFMRVVKCNSKTKALFFAAFLVARSSIAATYPVISSSSEDSVRISSTSVAKANGGGSYVTGMIEPLFSPGFQPWEPPPRRFALKGRQIECTNNAKAGPIVERLNCALYFVAQP